MTNWGLLYGPGNSKPEMRIMRQSLAEVQQRAGCPSRAWTGIVRRWPLWMTAPHTATVERRVLWKKRSVRALHPSIRKITLY